MLHDGPEQRLLAGELAERLAGLLELLTRQQREVLILRVAVRAERRGDRRGGGLHPGRAVRVAQHGALNRLRAAVARTCPRRSCRRRSRCG
jgi:RNA polymerase sigma-70 factor (ECF subfamily)